MKIMTLSLLLLMMANLACGMNRRMLMIEADSESMTVTEQPSKVKENEVRSLNNEKDSDPNNHHSIPRQSFGGWDDHPPGPDQNP
ncbi:hypothetical protein RGQ29_026048 [Quercus rubra]|uniref:Uncharacterized protein n=1 Tax=Quercus rubra TaxID=3512 RepID=A0AAN7IMR9_QUERU|nr:hypothetical protein RGQ29_026048 [Quercus rubra]